MQRPTAELPRDVAGLRDVIDGLQALYPDGEGHGPAILKNIKRQIERAEGDTEELDALKEAYDAKLSELVLRDMDKFPDKKTRFRKGMNEVDAEGMERMLKAGVALDFSMLSFFNEEAKKSLEVKAEQKLWEKGLIGRVPEKEE